MRHMRRNSSQRGAALIYILAFTAVVLLIFSATFHSFNVLRQTNRKIMTDLQKRASALRVERPTAAKRPPAVQTPVSGSKTD